MAFDSRLAFTSGLQRVDFTAFVALQAYLSVLTDPVRLSVMLFNPEAALTCTLQNIPNQTRSGPYIMREP